MEPLQLLPSSGCCGLGKGAFSRGGWETKPGGCGFFLGPISVGTSIFDPGEILVKSKWITQALHSECKVTKTKERYKDNDQQDLC